MRNEERFFAEFSPAPWAEVGGLADGLGVSMERAVFCFANNGIEWVAGKDLPVTSLAGQLGGLAHPFEWPPARRK